MPLNHRVRHLERRQKATAGPAACPTCGWYEGKPMKFAITSREPDQPQPSDFCATCGHQWRFHMKFDRCG